MIKKENKLEIEQLRGIHVYFNEFHMPRGARCIANPRLTRETDKRRFGEFIATTHVI